MGNAAASSHKRHSDAQSTLHHPTGSPARRRQRVNHPQAFALGKLPGSTPVRPAFPALGRSGGRGLVARPGSVASSAEGEAVMRKRAPGRHPKKRDMTRIRLGLGLRPRSWTRAAFCSTCGLVWIPPRFVVSGSLLSWCPWCNDAVTRGVEIVERPMAYCQGCRFFLRHPRGDHEPGGCAIGNGAWRPNHPHECPGFRP